MMPTPQPLDLYFRGGRLRFVGTSAAMRALVRKAVLRLPDRVRHWMLFESSHVVYCSGAHLGAFFRVRPGDWREVRLVCLSGRLQDLPAEEALWVIGLEVARSFAAGGVDGEADGLAEEWGFTRPSWRRPPPSAPARRRRPRR
jgi:hypothetical protein